MRYQVTIGERTFLVDLTGDETLVDGQSVQVDLSRVGKGPVHSLRLNDRSHRLVGHRTGPEGWDLHMDGLRFQLEAVDERTSAIRAMTARTAGASGPKPIVAPMPGMVVKIAVEVGDRVAAGQGIAIVEAMKMENELTTATEGIVTRIAASEGEAVEKDQLLVDLGPLPEDEEADEGAS